MNSLNNPSGPVRSKGFFLTQRKDKFQFCFFILTFLIFLTLPNDLVRAEMSEDNIHNPHHQMTWTDEQKEVWRTIELWNHAFANNDSETYFTFIADEITLVLPSSPYRVEGKKDDHEEFEFFLKQGSTKVGFFQEMQPYVFVNGDTAFVSYYSRGFYGEESGGMASFKETTILKKTNEGWKIVHIHLSK